MRCRPKRAPVLFLATCSETEPTSGTNKGNSHERYLIIVKRPVAVGVPDVDLYLRPAKSSARARIDVCEPVLRGVVEYPGDIRGRQNSGWEITISFGTSQTTRDICSRTADALTNKSLSLSLRARDRTTPHACVHHRAAAPCTGTWESKNPATSVRKFVRRRICRLHVAATTGTSSERCCNTCANNRFCCCRYYLPWLTYGRPALTSRSSS